MLVIDDDEPIHRMICEMLNDSGIEIVCASDAEAGLKALDRNRTEPVLVLIDVLMPGMDGLTLARKLGSRLTRGKLAIMSGHLSNLSWWPVDLRELPYLGKPFRMAELKELLAAARLESRRET
ncbi:MAG: response regulator [Opitutaceae bacterium]|nr:response regulator [Opitutaceae bacterium]